MAVKSFNMHMNNIHIPQYVIQYDVQKIDNFQPAAIFHFWDKALHIPQKGQKMHVMRDNALFRHFLTSNNFPLWSALGMQLFVTDRGTSVCLFGI